MNPRYLWLKDVEPDSAIVGNKARNLAQLYKLGFPVPDGFAATTDVYGQYMGPISHELMELMWSAKPGKELQEKYEEVKRRIQGIGLSPYDSDALEANYRQLDSLASVRSSSPFEDSGGFNFAGQHESYRGIAKDDLPWAVRSCWASLFTPRSIVYRRKAGLKEQKPSMAVLIHRFIESSISGVVFTRNPVTGDEETVIEYHEGRGGEVVGGEVIPRRATLKGQAMEVSDENYRTFLKELARTCKGIEDVFGFPQDVEWVLDMSGKLYIIQARPLAVQLK